VLKQILAAAVSLSTACAAMAAGHRQYVSVCELQKAPRPASGSEVYFHAILVTDLFEHSALIDARCPSVHLSYQLDKAAAQNNGSFVKALYRGTSDGSALKFEIWGTGRFLWQPGENPPGVIDIEKISSFRRLRRSK
jgi:hypothetical protein